MVRSWHRSANPVVPLHHLWPGRSDFQGRSHRQDFGVGSDHENAAVTGCGQDNKAQKTFSSLCQANWHPSPAVCTKSAVSRWRWAVLGRTDKSFWCCSSLENRCAVDPGLLCIHFPAPSLSLNDFLPPSTCFYFLPRSSAWPTSKTQIRDMGRQIYLPAMLKQTGALF